MKLAIHVIIGFGFGACERLRANRLPSTDLHDNDLAKVDIAGKRRMRSKPVALFCRRNYLPLVQFQHKERQQVLLLPISRIKQRVELMWRGRDLPVRAFNDRKFACRSVWLPQEPVVELGHMQREDPPTDPTRPAC